MNPGQLSTFGQSSARSLYDRATASIVERQVAFCQVKMAPSPVAILSILAAFRINTRCGLLDRGRWRKDSSNPG
jgi:hypothetical protein